MPGKLSFNYITLDTKSEQKGFHYLPNLKGHYYCNWVDFTYFQLKYTSFYETLRLQLKALGSK